MVQLVLQLRDYLKASTALGGVPELLSKIREVLLHIFSHCLIIHLCLCLKTFTGKESNCSDYLFHPQSPDFYMEMKWEFTSWSKFVCVWAEIYHECKMDFVCMRTLYLGQAGYQWFYAQKKMISVSSFKCSTLWFNVCTEMHKLEIRSYRKHHIPFFWHVKHLLWFRNESQCFICADTFLSIVEHLYAVVSQSLLCPGFVQVMFVAFGNVALTCEWMPLFLALKTWPGSEGEEATSLKEMVCVLTLLTLSVYNLYHFCKMF